MPKKLQGMNHRKSNRTVLGFALASSDDRLSASFAEFASPSGQSV